MLELRGLQVQYGSIVAVRDLSLSVNEGELVALIGANGAGKTTTLATIAGVLKPRKGSIALCGHSIAALPPANAPTT
jgi:branched-chain amino acid transport system ATP-binding protein